MAAPRATNGRVQRITLPYRPLPKQAEFHKLNAKYRGFCGGWGNGKTSGCCAEFFTLLMEFPQTNSICARKTRPELKSTTWDMLLNGDPGADTAWHGIPKEVIKVYNKSDLYLELSNGSKIWGLPLDDPKKLENYNLGLYWIDQAEEIEEDLFLKFQGRLRQIKGPRMGLLSFNPNGHNWIWKRFIDPKRKASWQRLYKAVEATTFDNPNLPQDYFDQFEGLPDHWLQRFVHGSHEVFLGQIFTDFNEEIHVVQPFHIPREWERWMCFDPGMRHEAAASWIARDPHGNAYYYREHLESGQPVEWWSEKIAEMEADDDFGGPWEDLESNRLIGPEAEQRAQTDGKSVRDKFSDYGMVFELTDRSPSLRISTITSALRPQSGHRNPFTGASPAPSLYIFSTCEKLIEYLPQYRWKPQRTNFTEEHEAEAPRKKDDHNIDNLGHVLVHVHGLPPVPVVTRQRDPILQLLDEAYEEEVREHQQRSVGARGHSLLGDH